MGKKAIYQPTIITEPGYYYLIEDVVVAGRSQGPLITIQARDVTLDLNGLSIISGDDAAPAIILLDEAAQNTIIQNGNVRGAEGRLIASPSQQPKTLRLNNIIFKGGGGGIDISVLEEIEIIDCSFSYGGTAPVLNLNSDGDTFRGKILNNTIKQAALPSAIVVHGLTNGEVNGNLVQKYGAPGYPGSGAGLLLSGDSSGNVISMNIFNEGGENVPGIEVHGSRNLIENNQIIGNGGPGISFVNASSHNAYRQNMLRGNLGGAVVDLGNLNTDEGGNII